MWHVISAIEIVVDEHFPVAVNVIASTLEEMEFFDAKRSHALDQPAEKLLQRRCIRIEVHEHKAFPRLDANRQQTVLRPVELFHPFKFRHAFERTIQTVLPAMVRTLQYLGVTARLGNNRGRMMAAYIEEPPQPAIRASHYDDRLSCNSSCDEIARIFQLIGARDQLPGFAEYIEPFELCNTRIDVPRRRDREGFGKRSAVVVTGKNLFDSGLHVCSLLCLKIQAASRLPSTNQARLRCLLALLRGRGGELRPNRPLQDRKKLLDSRFLAFREFTLASKQSRIEFRGKQRILKT